MESMFAFLLSLPLLVFPGIAMYALWRYRVAQRGEAIKPEHIAQELGLHAQPVSPMVGIDRMLLARDPRGLVLIAHVNGWRRLLDRGSERWSIERVDGTFDRIPNLSVALETRARQLSNQLRVPVVALGILHVPADNLPPPAPFLWRDQLPMAQPLLSALLPSASLPSSTMDAAWAKVEPYAPKAEPPGSRLAIAAVLAGVMVALFGGWLLSSLGGS